jgi:hypothetical protein
MRATGAGVEGVKFQTETLPTAPLLLQRQHGAEQRPRAQHDDERGPGELQRRRARQAQGCERDDQRRHDEF